MAQPEPRTSLAFALCHTLRLFNRAAAAVGVGVLWSEDAFAVGCDGWVEADGVIESAGCSIR